MRLVARFFLATVLILAGEGSSAGTISCQKLSSACSDAEPRSSYFESVKRTVSVNPPFQDEVNEACWTVQRRYQCVEKSPTFSCASGRDYATVKADCSLTSAAIKGTVTINAVKYLTDAEYTYRCGFENTHCDTALPGNTDCRVLTQAIQTTGTTTAATTAEAALVDGNWVAPAMTEGLVTDRIVDGSYVCYTPPVTTCADTCQESFVDPVSGKIGSRNVACKSPVTNCVASGSQCTDTNGVLNIGPDGKCTSHLETSVCQAGETPRCLTNTDCALESATAGGVQANGVAYTEKQTYLCSNTKEECLEVATVSNCVSPNAWGWDKDTSRNPAGKGLGEVNAAIAKVEGIQKGVNNDDFYLFSGLDRRCSFPVGSFWNTFISIAFVAGAMLAFPGSAGLFGSMAQAASGATLSFSVTTGITAAGGTMSLMTANAINVAVTVGMSAVQDAPDTGAFGNDCCKSYIIKGSDAWYKSGSCSTDEVKLAVAKNKGLVHYLGEYCSKRGGFPLRECKQKTRSYCVYDDMLALMVNEQGREQLDDLVDEDVAHTSTSAAVPFELYQEQTKAVVHYADYARGAWQPIVAHNGSQVWYWKWPSYCKTSQGQAAAFALYKKDVEEAGTLERKGPFASVADQNQYLLELARAGGRLGKLPVYHECSADPGYITFMTCSRDDDACAISHQPEMPGDVSTDETALDAGVQDPDWEEASVNTRSKRALAGKTVSVNNYVGAVGSCQVDGHCLYSFKVLEKRAGQSLDPAKQGAIRRTRESFGFPLYAMPSPSTPAVDYLSVTGVLTPGAWEADVNRGRGDAFAMTNQQFIPRPNTIAQMPAAGLHSHVLLEWYHSPRQHSGEVGPIRLVKLPTSLPKDTVGFWPYRDPLDASKLFYIYGSCDPNSRWCQYTIEIENKVMRHPWGGPENPRCWGFDLDQMAALDFDKMDLSQWIDSLNLAGMSTGMSEDAAKAMKDQATLTADTFYQAYKAGASVSTGDGEQSLWVNTNTLPLLTSDKEASSFTVRAMVPSNWPRKYTGALESDYAVDSHGNYVLDAGGHKTLRINDDPVKLVSVFWGDGRSEDMQVVKNSAGEISAWQATHDYGNLPAGTYQLKVVVVTTKSGQQYLTTDIKLTPDQDEAKATGDSSLVFNRGGTSGASAKTYTPAETPSGVLATPDTLAIDAPGFANEFEKQGASTTKAKE